MPAVHSRAGSWQEWQHSSSCPRGTPSSCPSPVLPFPPQCCFVPQPHPADPGKESLKWQWSQTRGLIYLGKVSLPRQTQGWQKTTQPNKGNLNAGKLWCSSGWTLTAPSGSPSKVPGIKYLLLSTCIHHFLNSLWFVLLLMLLGWNQIVLFAVAEYWMRPSGKERYVTCFNIHSTIRKQWEWKLIHCQVHRARHTTEEPLQK